MGKSNNSVVVLKDLNIKEKGRLGRLGSFFTETLLNMDDSATRRLESNMGNITKKVRDHYKDKSVSKEDRSNLADALITLSDFQRDMDDYRDIPGFENVEACLSHIQPALDAVRPLVRDLDNPDVADPKDEDIVKAAVSAMGLGWTNTASREDILRSAQTLAGDLPKHYAPKVFWNADSKVENEMVVHHLRPIVDAIEAGKRVRERDIRRFQERAGPHIVLCYVMDADALAGQFVQYHKGFTKLKAERAKKDRQRAFRGENLGVVDSIRKGATGLANLEHTVGEGMANAGGAIQFAVESAVKQAMEGIPDMVAQSIVKSRQVQVNMETDGPFKGEEVLTLTKPQLEAMITKKVAEIMAAQK